MHEIHNKYINKIKKWQKGCAKNFIFDKKSMLHHNYSSFTLEAGTDEAGRGCLAGPVTAAAVILPNEFV